MFDLKQNRLSLLAELENEVRGRYNDRKRNEAYYEGSFRLSAMGMAIPPAMRKLTTVINWPRVYVDAIANRLNPVGVTLNGETQGSDICHEIWQDNNLDEEFPMAALESLVQRNAYFVVGRYSEAEPNRPLITVESGAGLGIQRSLRDKSIELAWRFYGWDGKRQWYSFCTLYWKDRTEYYERDSTGNWQSEDVVDNDMGRVGIVPLVNRSTLDNRDGRSEMIDVIPITDAACRVMTNLQGAQELMALPQRIIAGVKPEDFVDPATGAPKPAWEVYVGRVLALTDKDAKFGQFTAADLRNFTDTLDEYGKMFTSVTGLPSYYVGAATENPASAEAIKSSESRLIRTCERFITGANGTLEEVLRMALFIRTGEWDESAKLMEISWRDPSTPTRAAVTDAVVKQYQVGLIPREFARAELGYTPNQRRKMQEEEEDDPASNFILQTQEMEAEANESRAVSEQTSGPNQQPESDDSSSSAGVSG